jgi:HSP20 family protein
MRLIHIKVGELKMNYKNVMDGVSFATIPRPLPSEVLGSLPGATCRYGTPPVAWGAFLDQRWSAPMKLPSVWSGNQDLISDPFRSLRPMEDMFRAFYRNLPSLNVGAGMPAVDVAETKDAIEVSAELPGVDEKDIKVSLDGNRLVISGEKKKETKREEKDWHIEERSYGSFYRSLSLPFKPDDGAVEAHFDKGVLHLNIKKPAELAKSVKTIEIKSGAPQIKALQKSPRR